RRPDSGNSIELVDRGKGAVLLAVVEDLLGRDRADARQRIELLEGCGAELNRAARRNARRSAGSRRRRRRSGRPTLRTDDLPAVRERSGQVDEREVSLR